MNRRRRIPSLAVALIVLMLLAWITPGQTGAQTIDPDIRGGWQPGPDISDPSRVIVRFADTISTNVATDLIQQLDYSLYRVVDFKPTATFPNGISFGIVELPEEVSPDTAIFRLSNTPEILYVERDYIYYKDQVHTDTPIIPTDPYFDRLWGLHNENCQCKDPRLPEGLDPVDDADIDAPEAWSVHTGTGEVVVAIIDTGCYIYHPDLYDNIWVNEAEMNGKPGIDDDGNGYIDDLWGWNFYSDDNSVFDPDQRDTYGYLNDEHGTHCAGTIGAIGNNLVGVTGISWNVRIMPLKFIGPLGGRASDAILAFQYAADMGADIISCSWGGGAYSQALKDAIEATGKLVVCAAGNDGQNTDIDPHYPSSYDLKNIISVAAMMQNEMPCRYPDWWSTCYGATSVDLFAPGGYILSTLPPDPVPSTPAEHYGFFYGTSMATPHVSGAAALLRSLYRDMPLYPTKLVGESETTIKDLILDSVDVFPQYEGLAATSGRLNIANAIARGGALAISIEADPLWGAAPLEVSFVATATSDVGEILDKWWNFGDGNETVHEWETIHTYEEEGVYDASFHAVNIQGFEASATAKITVSSSLPQIEVSPTEIQTEVEWGETSDKIITISNLGEGDLTYTAEIVLAGMIDRSGTVGPIGELRSGGPDRHGYFWIDSDESGVVAPEWFDISEIGTEVVLGGDDSVIVDLSFEFPFYGDVKDSVRISSNGYLTFGESGGAHNNSPIPHTRQPNDLIAIFWNNLEPQKGDGKVFYYGDDEKFVVQYEAVPCLWTDGGPYTFQAILTPEGIITYLYKTMSGTRLDKATIGIENADGTVGLQVAYNEDYVHDNLAVFLMPSWVTLDKTSGTVVPGASDVLTATFAADNLPQGTWKAMIAIHSNDPADPQVDIDTFMFAKSVIPPAIRSISADPWAGSAPLAVQFSAVSEDIDGEIVAIEWDFGDGSDRVTGILAPLHTYEVEGEYTATLMITDDDGFTAESSVVIVVQDLPEASVDPGEFCQTMRAHRRRTKTLTVTNTGSAALMFDAEACMWGVPAADAENVPFGAGGPDDFGYVWSDSDEPEGPTFDWVEISEVGTRLDLSGDDSRVVELPFDFTFYGDVKKSMRICFDGYLTFGAQGTNGTPDPIPDPDYPNDMLAVYWYPQYLPETPEDGGVFCYYDAADDRFIVEWKDVRRSKTRKGSYTFQAILYPDGRIVYQYLDIRFESNLYAKRGTIGIENATGTDGLKVLHNKAGYVHDGLAIEFVPFYWLEVEPGEATLQPGESIDLDVTFDLGMTGSGVREGAVILNTNDIRKPLTVVPIYIEVIPNNPPTITACGVNPDVGPMATGFQFVAAARDSDGEIADKWWDFGDGSDPVHEFAVTHTYLREGKFIATFTAVDNDGYQVAESVEVTVCEPASAIWNPERFSLTLGFGQAVESILTLSNVGTGALVFGAKNLPDRVQFPERLVAPEDVEDPYARTAEGIYKQSVASQSNPWRPEGVGSVITSWSVPTNGCWGAGVLSNGNVVIGDKSIPTQDHVVTPDGERTGVSWVADFGGQWAADMAFDGEYLWQVNVGGDNAIYKMDPKTGEILGYIVDPAWAAIPQRGLAYNPSDDTFYIGGWVDDIIYKIKGESWDEPGMVIDRWTMPVGIAGLAYHPAANILAVTSNSRDDMIYFVDPDSHVTIFEFPHPGSSANTGAGCEFGPCGNLWVASQQEDCVYLVETQLGPVVSWLSWEPKAGSVPAGESANVKLRVDVSGLPPGAYEDHATLFTNDIENPMIVVPVTATITAPPVITEARVEPRFGEPPLEVTFHAAFDTLETPVASYGWDFGDETSSTELDVTHTYSEPGTYTARFSVVDEMGARDEAVFEIEVKWLPHATLEPRVIEVAVPPYGSAREAVALGNVAGNSELVFKVKVSDEYDSVDPGTVGDVITSWSVPRQITSPWPLGFDGTNLWFFDTSADHEMKWKNHIVTPDGVHTGTVFDAPVEGLYEYTASNMAYDANRNLMWQLNGWGDRGIWGLDPDTGEAVMTIMDGSWNDNVNNALAYCADDDTFYVGPRREAVIYHVCGPSYASPGSVIATYTYPFPVLPVGAISGFAWHPDGILWVAHSYMSAPDMLYALDLGLDTDTLEVVCEIEFPSDSIGGIAVNEDGNLWVTCDSFSRQRRCFLINTGMSMEGRGIIADPRRGRIAAGKSGEIGVKIEPEYLGNPGDDVIRSFEIKTNDPENPSLYVDVIVHIEAGPTIVRTAATPTIGEPPLKAAFDATVEPGATDIVDIWWDFGDGSNPVHEAVAEHIYTEIGEYEASVHAIDENEVEASAKIKITVKWLPALEIEPGEFDEVVLVGSEKQTTLTLSNTGVGPMDFEISVTPSFAESPEWMEYAASKQVKGSHASEPRGYAGAGAGGPDQFGYVWIDSNHTGGPEFDWFEIGDVGTRLSLYDESTVDVDLPFSFPFYGDLKTKVHICSNGYLTFGTADSEWINAPIPFASDPNDLIAAFWDDLNPGKAGNVYYYHDQEAGRFIVEYCKVESYTGSGEYTFQAILYPNGTIVFQYLEMIGELTSATVGIENATGTDGLQAVYNAPYIEDGLAIGFAPVGSIIKVNPTSGYIVPGENQEIQLTFGSPDALYGTYSLYLYVSANDPYRPFATIPVTLKLNAAPSVAITAPEGGDELHGMTEITWTATDPDDDADDLLIDLAWTRDGETWHELGAGLANTGSFEWNTIEVGEAGETFLVRARATDPAGAFHEFVTDEFTIVNLAPNADFSFTPSPATRRDKVKFVDESTDDGRIVAWHWEFGDETTSDAQNPEHQYAQKGEFDVKLTVTDNGGLTGTVTKTIQVGNAAPIAAFNFTPSPATVNDIIRFTDETIDDGEIVAWCWEFGDGAESHEANPEHKYAKKGIFAVKLTVTDDGDLADTAEETIEIINLPPEVEIITPTAGQVLTGEVTIEWKAVDPDDDADALKIILEYKPASGGDWQTIASEQPNTGKYIWDTSKLERGGKYEIRITAVDPEGASGEAISEEFTVIALTRTVVAAPNPTSDLVTFYYDIASDGTLYVYDIAGRLVHSAELSATANAHEWNLHSSGKPVANGVYLYVVIAGEERSEVGRLVVSR